MANEAALTAFVGRHTEIEELLARLTEASNNLFNTNPETIHWGHVTHMASLYEALLMADHHARALSGAKPT